MLSDPTNLQAAVAHAANLLNKSGKVVVVAGSKVRFLAKLHGSDPVLDFIEKSQYVILIPFLLSFTIIIAFSILFDIYYVWSIHVLIDCRYAVAVLPDAKGVLADTHPKYLLLFNLLIY